MEFDKAKIFTPINFDEVKIGSKGYFADTKDSLIDRVLSEDKSYYHKMIGYNKGKSEYPFISDVIDSAYHYFYLVEEPKEKTKRPCTTEELLEMLKNQRVPLLKTRNGNLHTVISMSAYYGVTEVVTVANKDYNYKELCEQFTLLDGTELWVYDVPPECISPTPDEIGG